MNGNTNGNGMNGNGNGKNKKVTKPKKPKPTNTPGVLLNNAKPVNKSNNIIQENGKVVWPNKNIKKNNQLLTNNKAELFHCEMWRKTKHGHIIRQPGTSVGKKYGIGHKTHRTKKIPTLIKKLKHDMSTGKQIVYSRFIKGLTKELGNAGWIKYSPEMMTKPLPSDGNGFIVINNVMDEKQRKLLMKGFNHMNNNKGNYINVILVHQNINIIAPKCIKTIHIFEPSMTSVDKKEVIKRAVRCPGLKKSKFHNMKVCTYFSLKKGDEELKNKRKENKKKKTFFGLF